MTQNPTLIIFNYEQKSSGFLKNLQFSSLAMNRCPQDLLIASPLYFRTYGDTSYTMQDNTSPEATAFSPAGRYLFQQKN